MNASSVWVLSVGDSLKALFGGSFCYSNQLGKLEAPPNKPASSSNEKLQKPPITLQVNKLTERSFLTFNT
jgi:hypothetical protein